jgi:hypothetical protein
MNTDLTKEQAIRQCNVPALRIALRKSLVANRDNIPNELKAKNAWLVWRVTSIDSNTGKFSKIPVSPRSKHNRRGTQGSAADLANLGTWAEAMLVFEEDVTICGVGFAMLPQFGITALDADGCIEDNGLSADVAELVEHTYCELSPGGRGVRAFWLGAARGSKNHAAGMELFHENGFVTVTGEKYEMGFGGPLPTLSDEMRDHLERLCSSGGTKTRRNATGSGRSVGADADPSPDRDPDVTVEMARGMLEFLDPECGYRPWLEIAFGLHHQFGADGFKLWNDWSANDTDTKGTAYPGEDEMRAKWRSIRHRSDDPVTIRTVMMRAREAGWSDDVAVMFDQLPESDEGSDPDVPPESQAQKHSSFPAPFRGAMGDAVAAALAVAPKPQPELTTLAALIGMASACQGIYHLPSGGRLNLYGCGVAETAEGKDIPRKLAMEIARAANSRLLGKPASGQGLEDELVDDAAMLIELDEMAHMFAMFNSRNAPPHLIELAGVLLRLFSSSSGRYNTRVRAQAKNTKPARTLNNPVLSLVGFATPEKLGEALSISNIEDGLLGRHLFAFGRSGVKPRRIARNLELPITVRNMAAEIATAARDASTTAAFSEPGTGADASIPISIDPAADARLDELIVEFDARRTATSSPFAKALFGRSYEKAERVAGVLAVWDNPSTPVITLEHVAWAEQCLIASDNTLLHFSGEYMHGGQVQADAARVLKTIPRVFKGEFTTKNANEDRMVRQQLAPWSMLMRTTKLDKRRMDDAVDNLLDLGEIEKVQFKFKQGDRERAAWTLRIAGW